MGVESDGWDRGPRTKKGKEKERRAQNTIKTAASRTVRHPAPAFHANGLQTGANAQSPPLALLFFGHYFSIPKSKSSTPKSKCPAPKSTCDGQTTFRETTIPHKRGGAKARHLGMHAPPTFWRGFQCFSQFCYDFFMAIVLGRRPFWWP